MTHNPHTDFPAWCRERGACRDGQAFADTHPTLESFWSACQRPDWMFWVYNRLKLPKNNERSLRLFAVWCARSVPQTDPRSVAAIDCAERFAIGLATADELSAAESAAESAASAAWSAAARSARSAAESAWSAAESAAARSARSAAESAWSAAESAAWSAQSDKLRESVSYMDIK